MIVSFDTSHKLLVFCTGIVSPTFCNIAIPIDLDLFLNQLCGMVLSETQYIDAYNDVPMDRNERRTRWISGWMGLDLFLWRLSSMDVVWFLITSDLTVCRFYLSSRTATISWSVHDKSSRYETTEDSSNRWNSRVTVMTFSRLFLARSADRCYSLRSHPGDEDAASVRVLSNTTLHVFISLTSGG